MPRIGIYLVVLTVVEFSTYSLAQRVIPEASTTFKPAMGQGYLSQRQTFGGICLVPENSKTKLSGAQKATLYFDQTMTQGSLAQELGFDIGGKARFGVGEASASAHFESASSSSSSSIVSTYKADYIFKSERMTKFTHTSVGDAAAINYESWGKTCGDEVVTQIDYGAKLFFTIRLDFSSSADRSAFLAKVDYKSSLYEANASLSTASSKSSSNARVTIGVLQLGGDISQISRIFDFEGSKENRAGFVSCTLGDFSKCSVVLQQALAYAASNDASSFPNQVKNSSKDPDAGPAELAYITQTYETIGKNTSLTKF